jgi:hypothetical protein
MWSGIEIRTKLAIRHEGHFLHVILDSPVRIGVPAEAENAARTDFRGGLTDVNFCYAAPRGT